jgi:hypothetical protein
MRKISLAVQTWGLLALLLATALLAQDPIADVEVILTEPPPPITPPDSFGTFSFVLTNHGPDTVGDPFPAPSSTVIVGTNPPLPYSEDFGRPILLGTDPNDDCQMTWGIPDPIPGDPPVVFYVARFFGIEPGATARCDVTYYVKPHLVDDFEVTWQYIPTPGIDPDLSNNTFTTNFRLGLAEPIPTLTPTGSGVLVVALFVAFAVLRRRRGVELGR